MAKFEKGQSGNYTGRPPGSTTTTRLRQAIEESAPQIIAAMLQKALDGDTTAAKLLLDKIMPSLKVSAVTLEARGETVASSIDLDSLSLDVLSAFDAAIKIEHPRKTESE